MKNGWLVLAMTVSAMTLGAAVYDASTGYVTLQYSGSGPNDSPLNYQKGIDSKGTAFWSDGLAIHSGTNYYLSKFARTVYGGQIKDNGTNVLNIVVPANKVVLNSTFNLKTYYPYRLTFANEGLYCVGSSAMLINDSNMSPFLVEGQITLQDTTQSNNLQLKPWSDRNGQTIQINAAIRTTATTDYMYVPRHSYYYGNVKLLGDMTEYDGYVNVSSNRLYLGRTGLSASHSVVSLNNEAELTLEATAGTVVPVNQIDVNTRSKIVVPATNSLHASKLRINGGTSLVFDMGRSADPRIIVDTFTLRDTGSIAVRLTGSDLSVFTNDVTRRVLVKSPKGTLDLDRFALADDRIVGLIPECSLSVESDESSDFLVVSWKQIVQQVVSVPSAANVALYSQATTWSNGKTPVENAGCDFYSPGDMSIYFPGPGTAWTFPGRSLVKDGGTMTFQAARPLTISNLFVKAGTTMRMWANGEFSIISPLAFYGGTALTKFTFGNQTKLEWRGPISGEAQIRPAIRQFGADKNDWAPCSLYPSGDNSGFKGTWLVQPESTTAGTNAEGGEFTGFENYYMGLVVSSQSNLGGPLDAFRYDALKLCDWQALVARTNAAANDATVTLDDATRGIDVLGTAQFLVDGDQMLAVKVPLTIAGAIKKKGTGTLALGGAKSPRYLESKQWTPEQLVAGNLTNTNVLWIAEGGLKPLSKEATDGLAIKVGASGALRLDLVPMGDVATYGLYNKAWATPLVAVDGTGAVDESAKIAVAFDPPAAGIESKTYTVPVCTVSTDAAASLRGKFACVRPDKNLDVRISEVADASAGTVTFVATVSPSGCIIIFR